MKQSTQSPDGAKPRPTDGPGMRLVKLALVFIASGVVSSCAQDGPTAGGPAAEPGRLKVLQVPLRLEPLNVFKSFGTAPSKTSTTTLLLRAEITPPVIGGSPVYATSISVSEPYVFVTYSTPGAAFGGGIDVVDISSLSAPTLVSSVSLPDADALAATADGSRLYVGRPAFLVDSVA